MANLVEVVEIGLSYEGGVVAMFVVFGEDFFCEPADVFDGEGAFMLIVDDHFLILLDLE